MPKLRRGSDRQRQSKSVIEDMANAFTKPLIVFPGGWGSTIPKWIKDRISNDRLIQIIKEEEGRATEIEAVAYLYTASLVHSLGHDWTEIYLWLCTKCSKESRREVPNVIAHNNLNEDQKRQLDDLLRWLWRMATPKHSSGNGEPASMIQPEERKQLNLF